MMAATECRLTKVRAGLYRHEQTGRYIVSTSWDGPRGGTMWRWEHASDDRGALTIDGTLSYRTLREAAGALDAH